MVINIQDDILKLHALGLLDRLLQDKATKGNILWATDAYADLGEWYSPGNEIRPQRITGEWSDLIKTRARRAMEQRTERTRLHAEVFTPLWIVKKMNDFADEQWFKRKSGIYKLTDEGKIYFSKDKHWKLYVDARRMEITCGEAPFLVTRYDVETGEAIPIEDRIGLLDRKLRAVTENTHDIEEWKTWALRAVQATYGFELQGDNLLIARVNILCSVEEHMFHRWRQGPDKAWLEKLCNVISWNLWQMDGIHGCVPVPPRPTEEQLSLFPPLHEQTNLFGEMEEQEIPCLLYNWRHHQDQVMSYTALRKKGSELMKFDFIIGNPPYQEESTDTISSTNGQKPRTNIFHFFQLQADEIAENGEILIYPAGRWIHRSGKGMAEFGLKQINDPHLSEVIFFPDAKEVFSGVQIADGISIVVKNQKKVKGGFTYTFVRNGSRISMQVANPGEDLIPLDPRDAVILDKVEKFVSANGLGYLHDGILPRTLFGIESNFVQENPDALRPYSEGDTVDFTKEIKVFTNDKAGKAGRAKWFVGSKSIVQNNPGMISEFQVVVSSANAGGQKRDNQLEIIDNHSVFGRARVALRSFKTMGEAENFYKYVRSYLVRYTFLMTDEALSSLGKRVPDIGRYDNDNKYLDFSNEIDPQLSALIGLSDDEMDYIKSRVDGVRRNRDERT